MGLAAPVAMMVGCGRAAALGIFIRNGDVLERLAEVDGVAFDKTGTLTERHAEVTAVTAVPGTTAGEVVALAAALETESDHPIASAIVTAAGLGTTGSRPWRSGPTRGRAWPARWGDGPCGWVGWSRAELPSSLRGPIWTTTTDGARRWSPSSGTGSPRDHRRDHPASPRGGVGGRPPVGHGPASRPS